MVLAANALRIRRFLGLLTLILGVFAVAFSVSAGIIGLVMYLVHGDLLVLGNPGAGPGVAITLIIEGLMLELTLAVSTSLFGFIVKGLQPSPKKSKSDLTPRTKEESNEDEKLEGSPMKERKAWSRLNNLKEDFEIKAPKCLWVSLLLLAGMNLGLSLTCYLLAWGSGPTGMGLAMRTYGMDPAMRRAIDWVQQAGECCGDQVYTDWLNVQWCTERPNLVPSEVGPPGYVNVCGPKHRSVKNDVPQSCCTPQRSPCIHDALDLLGLGPLHNDGCSTYIEDQLDPKLIAIAKFHLFLCGYKILLVALVLILRTKEDTRSEKATDEEAKGLLDDEDTRARGDKSEGGAGHQPPIKSWLSAISKIRKPQETSEESASKGGQDDQSELKPKQSKKLWYSATKITEPLKRMSKVVVREESRAERGQSPEVPPVELEEVKVAAPVNESSVATGSGPPGKKGPSARVSRPASQEPRGFEARVPNVSRARSFDAGPVTPRPVLRGSLSEWRSVDGSSRERASFGKAAEITPSKHEEHRLSAGVVH